MHLSSLKQNKADKSWNEWLAGLIDAGGCLLISSDGYPSLEITMGIFDKLALMQIKQKLNGSVKLRSKAQAFRYRLHNKKGMLILLSKINSLCQNPIRLFQLEKMCSKLNLIFEKTNILTLENGWFAGFFDGDGTIGYFFKNGWPQLILSVSNKKIENCQFFQQFFGGKIHLDKRCNTYKWALSKKEEILFFANYLTKYPLRSFKKKRFFLISEFFALRQIRAYAQPPETLTYKAWCLFEKKWSKLA
uniref:Putative lAGLIDADG homing endonuclease n=1 Tax=Gloeotilopsis planctonica TaxID=34157 RepID=A0A1B2RZA8_9CHLO|nr:putative lAGLIDADG homing endonuclease [Gloeotilopsis planctonica]